MQTSLTPRRQAQSAAYELTRSPSYSEHEHADVHGFSVTDATVASRSCSSLPSRDLIWVGCGGEGRWLRPEDALELAATIEHVANSHIERVFKERHRVFLANHPGAGCAHASTPALVWLCGCGAIDEGAAAPGLCANCENAWRWQRVANNDAAILHALCEGSGTYCETEAQALLAKRRGTVQ